MIWRLALFTCFKNLERTKSYNFEGSRKLEKEDNES